MAADSTTDEIRRRADLTEVVGQYVSLRPAGNGRFKACCPFHDEKTPSFSVSQDQGFYKCFGCGKAGDVFRFLMEMENVTFLEARSMLAERYGVVIPERREMTPQQKEEVSERERLWRISAAAAAYFRDEFTGNGGLQARDYARGRGLSRQTLEKFGIGYAADGWDGLRTHLTRKYGFKEADVFAAGLLSEKREREGEDEEGATFTAAKHYYDRFRHRLMFPIWDESGRAIAFGGRALEGGRTGNPDAKYLNSPESPIFHKSNVLFAWHIARPEVSRRESVIITEGYMDAIALHEAGFPQTVATLGTALTAHHVALLRRLSPKVVYLCFDGDSAGMRAALRTAPLFAANTLDVRVVRFPKEDDPDTYVRKHGAIGLENALRGALPLARYRLEAIFAERDLGDLSERAEAMRSAAEVIADVASATEREGYIAWLTDRIAALDGNATLRGRQFTEAAVRRELGGEQKRVEQAQRKWIPREEWKPGMKRGEAAPIDTQRVSQEAHEVAQTLAATGKGIPSGVLKAEKALLCSMLAHPEWRAYILEHLPLEKWTNELHGEVVCQLRSRGPDAEIVPVQFAAEIGREAAELVAEVMMGEEASSLPDARVIDGWIARVTLYWSQQDLAAKLSVMQGKIQRGEEVSGAEREALAEALKATGHKQKLPER